MQFVNQNVMIEDKWHAGLFVFFVSFLYSTASLYWPFYFHRFYSAIYIFHFCWNRIHLTTELQVQYSLIINQLEYYQ